MSEAQEQAANEAIGKSDAKDFLDAWEGFVELTEAQRYSLSERFGRLRKNLADTEKELGEAKNHLNGDPEGKATREDVEHWRKSAINYGDRQLARAEEAEKGWDEDHKLLCEAEAHIKIAGAKLAASEGAVGVLRDALWGVRRIYRNGEHYWTRMKAMDDIAHDAIKATAAQSDARDKRLRAEAVKDVYEIADKLRRTGASMVYILGVIEDRAAAIEGVDGRD